MIKLVLKITFFSYVCLSYICSVQNCEICKLDQCFKCFKNFELIDFSTCFPKTNLNFDIARPEYLQEYSFDDDKFKRLSYSKRISDYSWGLKSNVRNIEETCELSYCKICENEVSCKECYDNYLNVNGTCESMCDYSCDVCKEGKCVLCKFGFSQSKDLKNCIECGENCFSCSEEGCLLCYEGYYNIDGVCSECNDNSISCESNLSSLACFTGYYLDKNLNCSKCPENCIKCSNFNSECLMCDYGFGLTSTLACKTCEENCRDCIFINHCLKCDQDYTLSANGKCEKSDLSNCMILQNNGKCKICHNNYFLNDLQTCGRCPSNCFWCSKEKNCIECISGYGMNDEGKCSVECPENCLKCDYKRQCFKCNDLYALTNTGECKACEDLYALQCIQTNISLMCVEGYGSGVEGRCLKCGRNCLKCISNQFCSVCVEGFGVLMNGKCERCPNLCLHCIDNQCIKCIDSFGLSDDYSCIPCPQFCEECLMGKCIKCQARYSLDLDGLCSYCGDENCLKCDFYKNCIECFPNYSVNTNNICKPCDGLCQECNPDSKCLACSHYLSISNETCIPLPDHCYKTLNSKCTLPSLGFFITSSGNSVSCSKLSKNKDIYSICQNIPLGFYRDKNSKIQNCPDFSMGCKSDSVLTCFPSFYKNSSNSCDKCPFYCEECNNIRNCSRFYFNSSSGDSGNTVYCGISCKSCDSYGRCSECNTGFYLQNYTCLPCDQNCRVCESKTKCNGCLDMHYLSSNGSCLKNPSGCKSVDNVTLLCTQCYKPLYLNSSNQCSACPNNCETCNSIQNCSKCFPKFTLKSNLCSHTILNSSSHSESALFIILLFISLLMIALSLACMLIDYIKHTPAEQRL